MSAIVARAGQPVSVVLFQDRACDRRPLAQTNTVLCYPPGVARSSISAYRSGFVTNRLRFPHWCFPGNVGVALLIEELNGKRNGRVIRNMQRPHEDDLVGYVLAHEFWDVVSFPVIAEVDATYVIESPFGSSTHHRRAGDVLHPEREPLATLESLRLSLGPYNFASR
ncbi:MAG: hypothetical protein ACRECP_08545 [Methylocella sp.]